MRYKGQTIVLVPWFDHEGMKQWTRLTFQGDMDRKFLFKKVVQWVQLNFDKKIDRAWVQKHCPIMNQYDKLVDLPEQALSTFDEAVEAWIKRLEEYSDEDENQPDTVLQSTDNGGAESPLPPVSDSN